jgi:hypothetical protein
MAFAAHVVSWFSFHTRSSLPFPLLGSAPLPINEVHQRQFMVEFGALEIRHGLMY